MARGLSIALLCVAASLLSPLAKGGGGLGGGSSANFQFEDVSPNWPHFYFLPIHDYVVVDNQLCFHLYAEYIYIYTHTYIPVRTHGITQSR